MSRSLRFTNPDQCTRESLAEHTGSTGFSCIGNSGTGSSECVISNEPDPDYRYSVLGCKACTRKCKPEDEETPEDEEEPKNNNQGWIVFAILLFVGCVGMFIFFSRKSSELNDSSPTPSIVSPIASTRSVVSPIASTPSIASTTSSFF